MSDTRNYEGDPIDASWSTAPWNRDGETVEASDDNTEEHSMDTIEWPENATPKEELNDDQIAVIRKAARYLTFENGRKLTRLAVGEKRSDQYANSVLLNHWPERYWGSEKDARYQDNVKKGKDNVRKVLDASDVRKARKLALDGWYRKDIAAKLDAAATTVGDCLRGDTWGDVQSPPPLKYDNKAQKWKKTNHEKQTEDTEQSEYSDYKSPTPTELDSSNTRIYVVVAVVMYAIYRLIRRLV